MRGLFFSAGLFITTILSAQQGNWSAHLLRPDGNAIAFTFEWKTEAGKPVWYIKNAAEKLKVDNITIAGDSFFVQMPVFESQFRFTMTNNAIAGIWIKGGAVKTQVLPFAAIPGAKRFAASAAAEKNVTGRWSVTFSSNQEKEQSVAEFTQKGNLVTGTVLSATGDFRYLEGIVTKDTLLLSAFDGGHAYLFKATINSNSEIGQGMFYSASTGKQEWTAIKDDNASFSSESVAMYVKPGQERLDFSFKNLEGEPVSINSERYKNKVVVIQLMGSWCPNCMDETAFLSDYYNKNKQRGVEVLALAYEYSTNWERSISSLKKFQQRFNVQYPVLNTGVAVTDSLRTEKTLPQVTRIKFFPSSIILDKTGKIRKLDTGFNGPATGVHYTIYKKEFEETINHLLKETPGTK